MWTDASAHWRMAQVAQISRQRILRGGFNDPASGLLCATNVIVGPYGNWKRVRYQNPSGGYRGIYGWIGSSEKDLWLQDEDSAEWAYAQSSGYYLGTIPAVKADSFSAQKTNNTLIVTCRFRFDAGGKTFTQQHTVRTYLVNEEGEE